MGQQLLSVEDLKTYFYLKAGVIKPVDGVTFSLDKGEALGIVGESGSGKSVTCMSLVRLVPKPVAKIVGGKIVLNGENLMLKSEAEMRHIRGKKISVILQDPLTSLNPVYSIGNQVAEVFKNHGTYSNRKEIKAQVIKALQAVNIPSAAQRLNSYPFEFSGGMRQRTVAGMAIAFNPDLLIADEPTTSLDVTIQDQFLQLLKEIQKENNMGLIMVTHDLAIVAEICDRVLVMYAGRIVESGTVYNVYKNPAHPYTQGLLATLPKLDVKTRRLPQIKGEPPNFLELPIGCRFEPRCVKAMDICKEKYPPVFDTDDGGQAACWLLSQ